MSCLIFHKWSAWITAVIRPGQRCLISRTCERCGATETKEAP